MLRLRKIEPTDLPYLYQWENDARMWADSDTHNPLSQADLREYIASSTGDIYRDGQLRLIIEDSQLSTLNSQLSTLNSQLLLHLRLPKMLTAILAGASLSVAGLMMQTLFRNPLAGPYVLGINAGASLGVALFTLALPMLGGMAGGISSFMINKGAGVLFTFSENAGAAFTFLGFEGKEAGYMIMFCLCAVAYVIAWSVMKILVPKYKKIA